MDYEGDQFDTKAAEVMSGFVCDWNGDHNAANAQDAIAAALKAAAEEARADEREACAKRAEDYQPDDWTDNVLAAVTAAIRARTG